MTKTKIFTIVFAITSIGLAYYLFYSINSSIQETKRIARMEKAIIDQLMLIRDAEIAYKAVNGSYIANWDTLVAFVDTGSFYIVERTETIITLDYGADSTYVEVDTLGTVAVVDSIFSTLPNFDPQTLPYVPGIDPPTKFNVWADKIPKAGLLVDAIEVWNPSPVDPQRSEDSEFNTKKPLRFGSRTSITTGGNWE